MQIVLFIVNSILFGLGLAMDAFSVSIATGINETNMKRSRMCTIAGTFALFQTAMPLIGWLCVHTIANMFTSFQKFIPWIALVLLVFIGGKMLIDGIKSRNEEEPEEKPATSFGQLMVQGIATSIDALSVGFTIATLSFVPALIESVIIGLVTFIICFIGLVLGRKLGQKLAGKATIVGGIILIAIGIEILLTSL